MMKLLTVLFYLALTLSASAMDFTGFGKTGSGAAKCPVSATQTQDGCLNAPAYVNATLSYQDANLMTTGAGKFFQSGQATGGVTSPGFSYNVAGKDFAVGVDMSKGQFANISVTNSNNVTVVVPHSFCNNTVSFPCTVTPGAEGLIDAAAYHWNTNPAGFGCSASSSISNTIYQIACIAAATTVNVDINGVDFQPNGQCYTLFINDQNRSVDGTVTLENFRWKNLSATQSATGCTSPNQGYSIVISPPVLASSPVSDVFIRNFMIDQNAGYEPSGVGAVVNYPRLTPTNAVISAKSTRDLTASYGTCDNLASRCMALSGCRNVTELALESSQIGWWPQSLHTEFSINLPIRNLDSSCIVSETIYNQTARTDMSSANSAASTAPISTSEPTNTNITGATFNSGNNQLTFTVSTGGTALGTTFSPGTYVDFLQNGTLNSVYVGWAPIVSSSGTGPYTVTVQLPSTTGGAGVPTVVNAANYLNLDVEFNTVASNHPGGVSPYYVMGAPSLNAAPTTGQTGAYAVGDILAILPGVLPGNSGAQACASPPLVYVSAVDGSNLATTIQAWDGGKCPQTWNLSTLYATVCVSSVAAGGCAGTGGGAGAQVKASYSNYVAGYAIQPAGYIQGAYTMAHNRIDGTAFPNLITNLNACGGGAGTYTDNYRLDGAGSGAKITAGAGTSGCAGSF